MIEHLSPTAHFIQEIAPRLMREPKPVRTPLGVLLKPVPGRFAIGQPVLAPGIDDCSAPYCAEVMGVGLRTDYPGIWYWVRERGVRNGHALVEEDALTPLHGGQAANGC